MISLQELNPHNYSLTPELEANLLELQKRMNVIREAYGKPMRVTSGLRSEADQARINPGAPKSKHLNGQACDISDKDGDLWKWCMINMDLIVSTGLWLEDKDATPIWVHFQFVPPASGKRIFKP